MHHSGEEEELHSDAGFGIPLGPRSGTAQVLKLLQTSHSLATPASLAFQPPFSCALLSEEPFSCPLCWEDPQLSGNLPSLPCPPTCRVWFQLRQVSIFGPDLQCRQHCLPHPTPAPQALSPSPAKLGTRGALGTLSPPVWCRLLSSVVFSLLSS